MSVRREGDDIVITGTVEERLEQLADHYGIDRAAMWAMTVREFADRIEAAERVELGSTGAPS
jgi:hypothetical protein